MVLPRYCPREGCGLHRGQIYNSDEAVCVAVPVRGAGCILCNTGAQAGGLMLLSP